MPPYINSGIGAQLVMIPESTYGVAPVISGANVMMYEFNTEGLEGKKIIAQGKGLHGGGMHNRSARRKLTNWETLGPVNMDLPARYLNQLLMQMLGSKGSSPATLTQIGVTTVYKAVHAPVSSMFGTSMCIQKGVPSVDGTAPQPFTYVGQKLKDWKISVKTGEIAKLDMNWVGRSELAGPTPIATPGMPASTTPVTNSGTVAAAVTITGGTLTAVVVNSVTVGTTAGTYVVPAGQTIAITYSVAPTWVWYPATANGDPLNLAVPPLATFSEIATNDVFFFREASLYTGGTPSTAAGVTSVTGGTLAANVKSAEIQYTFKFAEDRYFLGANGFKGEPIENDFRDIAGTLEVEFLNSEAMYAAFAADTPTALELKFTGTVIGTSGSNTQLLDILIPDIFFEGEPPKVNGPGVVLLKVPFTGLDDLTNNPIQITYQTLDTV